ncbi:cytochrome P450 [Daedaleopsis nitida]|nr:cytochrome P450 [Daedaleopsis nitida]
MTRALPVDISPQTLVVTALSAVAYLLWRVFYNYLVRYSLDNVPGPPPTSFLRGNTELGGRYRWKRLAAVASTYGPVTLLRGIFGRRIILIHDPRALHSMLIKDQEALQKGLAPSNMFTTLLGPGVLSTRAAQHRRQRKLLNPIFSVAHLRNMTHIFWGVAHKVQAAIKSRVPTDGSATVLDMNGWNGRLTLEMLGQAGLGYSFDNFSDDASDKYGESLKLLFPVASRVPLLPFAIDRVSHIFPNHHTIRRVLRLIPHRAIQQVLDISETMFQRSKEIVEERKEALRNGDAAMLAQVGEGKDIMSICLKANMAATDEEKMSDEEILAQTSTFILAGMDTTSNALSRILHQLAIHQDVQRKLRAELMEATDGGTTDLHHDDLVKLPYLDAVCRETLRLASPVLFISRTANKELVLPLSEPVRGRNGALMHEIIVPRGVVVHAHLQASNSNKALWGEDVDEWKPERWLKPLPAVLEEARLPGVYANLMTFSGGVRSCMVLTPGFACSGFKFSQLEMKVVLAVFLTTFSFELSEAHEPVVWNSSVVIYPTMGEKSRKPELLLKVKAL